MRIPPILMAGTRFFIAGTLMLAGCAMVGRRVVVTRDQLWRLAVVGVMLLSISNAVLAWAELYVPSGLAALIIAISPIWFLLIDRYLVQSGDRIGGKGLVGIALGVAGMVVLLWPRLTATHPLGWKELVAATSLLGSSFCWSLGSVVARHWRLDVHPLVGSGWQMTIAGSINLALGFVLGQHRAARWDAPGVTAVLYLVVFGSWVGYSAYLWLLRHVPTSKVATYAYVNPVVAVLLGWLFNGEPIDVYMVLGTAIIVAAVALVTGATTERPMRRPTVRS